MSRLHDTHNLSISKIPFYDPGDKPTNLLHSLSGITKFFYLDGLHLKGDRHASLQTSDIGT